ncbi:MAG: PilN domain-containing protein [Thermodesulfobacteriota bacterium]|nr:PilN domain-containing protein [Thermodesulfobacteriota bacterium]
MIRINLLPVRVLKKKETTRQMLSILSLSLGGLVLIIILFHLSLSSRLGKVEAQIAVYNEEIKKLKIDTKDVDKFKAEKEDLQRRLNIIYTLQRAKTGPVRVLDELATSLPGRLWLTSLKEKDGKMEMKGIAMDNPTIAQFMTRLEKAGGIKNVELIVSQQLERKDIKLKEFTLTCVVEFGLPPSGPAS